MRYGIAWILIGLVLIAKAVVSGGVWWIAAWPGVCGVVLGIAWLWSGPSTFGKRADGTLPHVRVLTLGPYFGLTWGVWHLARLVSRAPAYHELSPGLLLGRRPLGAEVPESVRLVVDMTSEFPAARGIARRREYVTLPTLDASIPPDADFAALVERIASAPGPVYVHCAAGHGRSATIAAAVLLARGLAASPEEAILKVQAVRPRARPNCAQRAALQRWWASGPRDPSNPRPIRNADGSPMRT